MLKLFNKLFAKSYFTTSLKIITLFILFALLLIGFSASSDSPDLLKHLRNTNMANLFVWSYWWPIIVILAIFLGRIWCMICPVELITSICSMIGFKFKLPAFFKNGWAITFFYALILFVGINIYTIHRNPTFMAIYLLSIIFVSVITGLLYEKNAFCRYFCPVGYLLGLYSRLSFIGLRVRHSGVCEQCKDKSCISKKYLYNVENKSCGVNVYPGKIKDNTDCILCAGCVKTCDKFNRENYKNRPNPYIKKLGFAHDLFKINKLKLAEVFFLLLVSGFVIYEILSEYTLTKELIIMIPEIFAKSLNVENKILQSIITSTFLFIMLPAFLLFIPFLVSRTKKLKLSFIDYLKYYSLAYLPLIAAAHLSKSLIKMSSRIPYFKYTFRDIDGIETANKILAGQIIIPKTNEAINLIVSILISAIFIFGMIYSIITVNKINYKVLKNNTLGDFFYLIPIVYSSIFIITLVLWRWVEL